MASSSSSSNDSSTTKRLTNSYFFYGTHPLKVPNVSHSNSSNDISTHAQTTQHLSLFNGSISSSDMPTTKSLHDISKSNGEDDETSEVSVFIMIIKKTADMRLDFPLSLRVVENKKLTVTLVKEEKKNYIFLSLGF